MEVEQSNQQNFSFKKNTHFLVETGGRKKNNFFLL